MPHAADPGTGSAAVPATPHLSADSSSRQRQIRATQTLISHMSFCWNHPSLVAIEIAWRWLFGIPFLLIAWTQAQHILAQIPPASVGLDRLDWQNPWLSTLLLADAITSYQPAVVSVLRWMLPAGIGAWAVVSALGRMALLSRLNTLNAANSETLGTLPLQSSSNPRSVSLRLLPGYFILQVLWALALVGCFWLWYRSAGWASATHLTNAEAGTQPDLVGYLCWLIFLSLGAYVLWALLSWALTIAPLLFFEEGNASFGATARALLGSFRMGKTLPGKLMEVSLVLAIVRIMLIVLDMVFSAAPLPFADQFGPDALQVLYKVVFIVFLIACDYFHVVRLRSFLVLWSHYRTF